MKIYSTILDQNKKIRNLSLYSPKIGMVKYSPTLYTAFKVLYMDDVE